MNLLHAIYAAYIRCSKDNDVQRQYTAIEAWARAHRVIIAHFYEDKSGRRGDDRNIRRRPEFQRLLADAQARRFTHILVEDQTRFGVPDVYAWMHYCYLLRSWGIQLIEATSGKLLNPEATATGEIITSSVGAIASTQELQLKAKSSLGGKLRKAALGAWQGGQIPYGLCVRCLVPDGAELWQVEIVNGKHSQLYPTGQVIFRSYFPRDRSPSDRLVLGQSRIPERITAVRLMYDLYNQGMNHGTICHKLNNLGHRTPQNKLFYPSYLWSLMRRGVHYLGRQAYAQHSWGKYARHKSGAELEVVPEGSKSRVARPESDWLWSDQLFGPIIRPETWEKAKPRLFPAPRKRSPRSSDATYAGILACETCGKTMSFWRRRGVPSYACTTYKDWPGPRSECPCGINTVKQEVLDTMLNQYLTDVGEVLCFDQSSALASILATRKSTYKHLADVRTAIERYLYEKLPEILPVNQQGKHRIFTLSLFDGDSVFRLPDFAVLSSTGGADTTIDHLVDLMEQLEGASTKNKIKALEARHDRLYDVFTDMPTKMMREKLVREAQEIEHEVARLRSTLSSHGTQYKAIGKQLTEFSKLIKEAQKAAEHGSAQARRAALLRVVHRVVCSFRTEFLPAKGVQGRVLDKITVIPNLPGPRRY